MKQLRITTSALASLTGLGVVFATSLVLAGTQASQAQAPSVLETTDLGEPTGPAFAPQDALGQGLSSSHKSCNEGEVQGLCTIPNAQGDCALGVIRCIKGQWSECLPRFRVLDERCGPQPQDEFGPATGDEDCDGEIDELGPNPPINCKMYMLDADMDGFGAMGKNYAEDPSKATYGCFCPDASGKVPLAFAVPSNGKHNLDCGDCSRIKGQGHLVYPGATEYYELPSECLGSNNWDGGAYDYNCSGDEEAQFLGIQGCDFDISGFCAASGSGFWNQSHMGNIPECGERGSFSSCLAFPLPLEGREDFCYMRNNAHPQVQHCR